MTQANSYSKGQTAKAASGSTGKLPSAQQAIDGKRVRTLLIMSAENPMGNFEIPENNPNPVCTAVSNKERTDIYAAMLRKHQFCCFPAKGKCGNLEYSFIVYNIALDDAMRLGRYFDQRDIIFGEVVEEGKVALSLYRKDESEFANAKDKTRNYRHKRTAEASLPVDSAASDHCAAADNTLQNIVSGMAFVNSLVEERSRKHWSYATRYNRNLKASISDNYTPWGRRQRRADLWGKHYELDCNAYEQAFPENNPNA